MNMPADLIRRIDEFANRMSLNRTSAMIFLVSAALLEVEEKARIKGEE